MSSVENCLRPGFIQLAAVSLRWAALKNISDFLPEWASLTNCWESKKMRQITNFYQQSNTANQSDLYPHCLIEGWIFCLLNFIFLHQFICTVWYMKVAKETKVVIDDGRYFDWKSWTLFLFICRQMLFYVTIRCSWLRELCLFIDRLAKFYPLYWLPTNAYRTFCIHSLKLVKPRTAPFNQTSSRSLATPPSYIATYFSTLLPHPSTPNGLHHNRRHRRLVVFVVTS